jgi:hypothetical protein
MYSHGARGMGVHSRVVIASAWSSWDRIPQGG